MPAIEAMKKAGYSAKMATKNSGRILKNIEKKVGKGWIDRQKRERSKNILEAFAKAGIDYDAVAAALAGVLQRKEMQKIKDPDGNLRLDIVPEVSAVNVAVGHWAKLAGANAPEKSDLNLNMGNEQAQKEVAAVLAKNGL